jgi:uncharacterized damage-inducible protein DinB
MSSLRSLRMLTRYSAWANDRMFEALAKLPEGAIMEKRATIFGNMLHTLNHNYVIDQIWQAHLEHRPHGFNARNTEAPPPLAQLAAAQRAMDAWYIDYADKLGDAKHDEIVEFIFVGGGAGSMTRGDILLHVVNHKTYHRGFVVDMICQVPARPPTMDLPVFLRDAPPDLRD